MSIITVLSYNNYSMSERRALLTYREKEILSDDADISDTYRYQTASRIRQRIKTLAEDVEFLSDERPDLYRELRECVCSHE